MELGQLQQAPLGDEFPIQYIRQEQGKKEFEMDFLCLDFINSRSGQGTEADDAWLPPLCDKWGLAEPEARVRSALPRLRDMLYRAAYEYSKTGSLSPGQLEGLNTYLEPVKLHNLLERDDAGFQIREIPQHAENALLAYRIVMSFADLIANHEAGRLKVCENPDCGWIFYDESKSRTRRWCDNTCASLIKVRRFRKKRLEM